MKFLVALSLAVACVAADVSHIDSQAPIVKSAYEISPEGAFQYGYETGNGISAQAQGVIKPGSNNEYPALEIQGAYRYNSPDGVPVEISYVANEFGYQATGNAIPTPHPYPAHVERSLAYIAAHPAAETAYVKTAKAPTPYSLG